MERAMRTDIGSCSRIGCNNSLGTCPSSSQRKKASGGDQQRQVHAFLVLIALFLICLLYLLGLDSLPTSLNSDDNISVSESTNSSEVVSIEWRAGSEEQEADNIRTSNDLVLREREPELDHESNFSLGSRDDALPTSWATGVSPFWDFAPKGVSENALYHNFALFERDYAEMEEKFRIWVYPEAYEKDGDFSAVFLPLADVGDRRLGNYYSEHKFKIALLGSQFVTDDSARAHLFFLPYSVNVLRNDAHVRQEANIISFVGQYIENVSRKFEFWNRSAGADHFFVCCHSVGRDVPQALPQLRSSGIQVACSSNTYSKNYVAHKDVPLPQVWPRELSITADMINTPEQRKRLAFFAGRVQNSKVRQDLVNTWGGDPEVDIYGGWCNGSYEQHFQDSKFCVHVRGYEVNTARISDAIHFGCVPVIISDNYDLPLGDILDWTQFSIIFSHTRIPDLKSLLQGVSDEEYAVLHANVLKVRKHFQWHDPPQKYDAFHLTMYQLWLRRFVLRESTDPSNLEASIGQQA